MVSTPDPSTQVDYLLTVGQVAPVAVQALEGGDEWPDGTYTLVGGAGLAVAGTAVLDGDTLTLDWPTNVHASVLSQPYEVRVDGLRFINGQVKAAPGAASGTRTLDVTLNLGGPTIAATITLAGTGGGSTTAAQVTTDEFTGRLEGLDQDVQSVLDMLDAGLDDHYVALFVTDDDYSGGTLTTVTMYDTGSQIPRSNVAGAPVCVVSGDDMGLWTVTASGPCTAGRPIDPGDIIRAFGQGFIAVAGSNDGETVAGINVAATYETVRALSTSVGSLSDGVDALNATVDEKADDLAALNATVDPLAKNATEAATGLALTAHAEGMGTVLAWAECGWGDEPGDMVRGYWSCPELLATPTTSLFKRALVRSLSAPLENPSYQEISSEPMDSLGVPGDGGGWDHDEMWMLNDDGSISLGDEWTANGGTEEWHTAQDPVRDPPYGPGIPPGKWVELAVAVPDFSDGILLLLARSDHGTYIDPWDGDKWRILQTFDLGEPFTMEDTTAVEMWIGRGGGRFDIARVRRWIDDVLVSDFNPFMGGNGATTIADQVLVDEFDDPAIWTAHDNAVNVNND